MERERSAILRHILWRRRSSVCIRMQNWRSDIRSRWIYYDIDRETPLTQEDLEKIEAEMKKIVKEALPIEQFTKPRAEAIAYFQEKEEPYKVD